NGDLQFLMLARLLPLVGAMRNSAPPLSWSPEYIVAAPRRGDEEPAEHPAAPGAGRVAAPRRGDEERPRRRAPPGQAPVAAPRRGDEEPAAGHPAAHRLPGCCPS